MNDIQNIDDRVNVNRAKYEKHINSSESVQTRVNLSVHMLRFEYTCMFYYKNSKQILAHRSISWDLYHEIHRYI